MNLAAINEQRFSCLFELTQNNNKARFLSQCLYRWQNSTYSLNDKKKWFTRPLPQLAKDSGISERSASRYLSEFVKLGLIEKRNRLFIKKHLYIRITDKLLSLLNIQEESSANSLELQQTTQDRTVRTPEAIDLANAGVISSDKSADSIYKENNIICNSTVSHEGSVNNAFALDKKQETNTHIKQTLAHDYKIETVLGERITERFKNYVKGVLKNLQTQHKVVFSNPDKLFAEVIFSVTNTKDQFPGIENPLHRMNIIAKLLRERRWKTPKGFYNHWDVGQLFKEREEVKQRQYQAQKLQEGVSSANDVIQEEEVKSRYQHSQTVQNQTLKTNNYKKSAKKRELNAQACALKCEIQSETTYLEQARGWFTQKVAGITESFLENLEHKIAGLYEELTGLEARLNAT